MKTTLSFSSLKAFSQSPDHFIAYKNKVFKPSSAMEFGTAVHMAVLEPELFHQTYDLAEGRKGTKIYKTQLEAGRKLLTQSEWTACHTIQEKVLTHPLSAELLGQCTSLEEKVQGEIEGHPFRGIVDARCKDFAIDLKTTKDGSPREFANSVWRLKYHLQAAIYCELTGAKDYWIIAVENTAPYVVTAYLLDQDLLDRGRELMFDLIKQFENWDGASGGYDRNTPNGFFNLEKPSWVV